MAAWSGVVALSGFSYDGRSAAVEALPRVSVPNFRCFWSTGTGWGAFSLTGSGLRIQVLKGQLACRSAGFRASGSRSTATLGNQAIPHHVSVRDGIARIEFNEPVALREGAELRLELRT